MRVFKKLELYDTDQSFKNWFSRIIIHASSDFYRYAKTGVEDLNQVEYYLEDQSESIIDQLNYQDLLSCITELSPQYRTVFNMYVIDGCRHSEIADMLKISVGTSKSNLSKAKRQLKEVINSKYEIKLENK